VRGEATEGASAATASAAPCDMDREGGHARAIFCGSPTLLGKWPIGDLAFRMNYLLRCQVR
jgi:hypothetical protein